MDLMECESPDEDHIPYDFDEGKECFFTSGAKEIIGGEFHEGRQDYGHDRRQAMYTAWVRKRTCRYQIPDSTEMSMDSSKIILPSRPAKSYFTSDLSKITVKTENKYQLPPFSSDLGQILFLHQDNQGEKSIKDEKSLKDQCSEKSNLKNTKSKDTFLSIISCDTRQQATTESKQKHKEMRQAIKIEDSDSENSISFGRPGFSLFDKASSTDSGYSNIPHIHLITDSSCSDISDLFDSNESDDQWVSFPEMHFSMPTVEKWNVEKKANNQKKIKSKKQKERQLKRKIIRTQHSAISFTDQLLEASTLEAKQMFTENSYRIIIVGTVGSGKSSLGNSLMGCQHFKTGISGSSVTRKCEKGEAFKHGKNITVVDTIGYTSEVLKKSKLLRAFDKISPGPHAVLNVIPFSERFTSEFFSSIQQFVNLVGKEVYNYLVIVLTHEDRLEMENLTIDEFIKSSPTEFKELLNQCENRIFAINNRATDGAKHKKVKRLIKIIEKIKRKNACFETYDEFLF